MNKEFYELEIAGVKRQLQLFPVSDTLDIAAFILFGDVELTEACAKALLEKAPEFDYIVTPEAKSIPLAYEMSKLSGKKYIVIRKGVKVYMDRPEKVSDMSITTQKEQALYLGHEDGDLLDGKRVLKEWRDERLENTDDMVTEELAKIARTEREAWEAWEKSKVDHTRQRETMTGRATNGGKMSPVAGVKSEESVYACGDTRYLDIINKVSMERRKLLGLYAPEKQELTGKDGAPIVPQMTLDDAQKILSMAD